MLFSALHVLLYAFHCFVFSPHNRAYLQIPFIFLFLDPLLFIKNAWQAYFIVIMSSLAKCILENFATCLVNYEFAHILKCLDLTDLKQYGWRKNELVKYLMLRCLCCCSWCSSTSQVCLLLFIDDPSASFRFTRIN